MIQSKQAETEKASGNQKFKKGDFVNALTHYSNAINFDPKNPIYWTNRAMTLLKLERFKEAESDCTKGLSLDPKNVKALWRRSIARKNLGLLKEAKDDLSWALMMEPTNKSVIEELKSVELLLKTREAKEKQESILEKVPVSVHKTTNTLPKHISQAIKNDNPKNNLIGTELNNINRKNIEFNPTKPKSTIEFERLWKESKNTPENIIKLLKTIEPNSLPNIFGSSFEEKHFVTIINSLYAHLQKNSDYQWTFKILEGMTKISRMNIALMFLSQNTKQVVNQILDEVSRNIDEKYSHNLKNIRRIFTS
ncbi:hypothetical protein BB558_002889 [Smittium angustum]|uniref:RNA polymerase II-associated protein 3 n=1 Tax=Smittium angustum TaxID=133377 RepID=A0A2U1J7N7_SMIAN|nr:hypothetical protein BB558_002889 [Smittium angustum]